MLQIQEGKYFFIKKLGVFHVKNIGTIQKPGQFHVLNKYKPSIKHAFIGFVQGRKRMWGQGCV